MVGYFLSQLKPSGLSIFSSEKGLGLRSRPFSQLRIRAPRALSYTGLHNDVSVSTSLT